MIKGLGSDLIEISRIKAAILRQGDRFLNRIWTKEELAYCLSHQDPYPHLAGRFAAKEAIVKAIGTGFRDKVRWNYIRIDNDSLGKPQVLLHHELKQAWSDPNLMISISHSKNHAMAVAIWCEQ